MPRTKTEVTKKEFTLPNKKIRVVPHIKPTSFIPDVTHVASFLAPRAKKIYVTPIDARTNRFKDILSEEERNYLEATLGRSLSIYDREDNYWETKQVILGKETIELDLSDPVQYIEWKILLANTLEICPDKRKLRAKLTYKYYMEDLEAEAHIQAEEADVEEAAWELFGDIKRDRQKMMNFLRVTGRRIDEHVSDAFLVTEIKNKYLKSTFENIQYFYNTLNSPDFDLEVMIQKALSHGVIVKDRNRYLIQGEMVANSKEGLMSFFKADKNQDTLLIVEEQVKMAE